VKRYGKPTWRKLVEAVENKVGGNNCALAKEIAAKHPGGPSNNVSLVWYTSSYKRSIASKLIV